MTAAQHWVLLADPETYGWNELQAAGQAVWDGIKNARAQSNLREMKVGDLALIYDTAPHKAVMGIARVSRAAYPDPAAAERVVIDLEPVRAFDRPVPLATLKADAITAAMSFVKMPRVAVQKVSAAQWQRVTELAAE